MFCMPKKNHAKENITYVILNITYVIIVYKYNR